MDIIENLFIEKGQNIIYSSCKMTSIGVYTPQRFDL